MCSTCYSDGGFGNIGLSWFNAMECCYYNKETYSHISSHEYVLQGNVNLIMCA